MLHTGAELRRTTCIRNGGHSYIQPKPLLWPRQQHRVHYWKGNTTLYFKTEPNPALTFANRLLPGNVWTCILLKTAFTSIWPFSKFTLTWNNALLRKKKWNNLIYHVSQKKLRPFFIFRCRISVIIWHHRSMITQIRPGVGITCCENSFKPHLNHNRPDGNRTIFSRALLRERTLN